MHITLTDAVQCVASIAWVLLFIAARHTINALRRCVASQGETIELQRKLIQSYPETMAKARKLYEDATERALIAEAGVLFAQEALRRLGFEMTHESLVAPKSDRELS